MRRKTQITQEEFPDQMGQSKKNIQLETTWVSGLVDLLLEIPCTIGEYHAIIP